MKKLLGIVVLSLSLSSCTDVVLVYMDESKYFNRVLHVNETLNLMGRKCVCLENVAGTSGIRDNLIGFKDDKLGYIKYRFDLEYPQTSNIASLGNYFIYDNFTIIKQGRWVMNLRGKILLDGDKKNSMRFHLKQEQYKDNNIAVKIKNNYYPEGKFFNINLILKDTFYEQLRNQ
tara:strand:- start:160 stop:681 length:522 start_codon:yes stop_codon:yes gene_type:complete